MLLNLVLSILPLINQSQVVNVLVIVVVFFGILLVLGIRKSFKLKKDNERLNRMNTKLPKEEDYKDFTDGHMYGNK